VGDNGKPAWAQTRPGFAVLVFTHKSGQWAPGDNTKGGMGADQPAFGVLVFSHRRNKWEVESGRRERSVGLGERSK
jgi:hypothetical protein